MTFYLLLNHYSKTPTIQFNITNYCNTCTSVLPVVDQVLTINANNKLTLLHRLNNTPQHSHFYQLPSPWNNMPVFDLDMTFDTLKLKSKKYLWKNFLMSTIIVLYIISVLAQDVTNPNLPLLTGLTYS